MPSDTTEAARLDLERFIPYRLSVLTNRMSSAIARHYSQRFSLSIPEWRVMAVLGGMSGLSAQDVAQRTAMDKVQVSRAVESLVVAGRVTRSADAKDGRVTRLSLSEKGRAIYEEVVPLALDLEEQFLCALSDSERHTFRALLTKLSGEGRLLDALKYAQRAHAVRTSARNTRYKDNTLPGSQRRS